MSVCSSRRGLLYEVTMANDSQLLRSYVEEGSEEAFQQLVCENIGLVYGVALRYLNGDGSLAEDACQVVFQSLARKATSLDPDTIMTGWLYSHAFHTATRMARAEKRRRLREARAAAEQEIMASTEEHDDHLERMVSELLSGLRKNDRAALLMRFYEERSFPEIGGILGVSEDAAEKRVARALEKMRRKLKIITASGTASTLAAYLSIVGATQVPASLASRILQQLPAQAAAGAAGLSGLTSVFVSIKTAKAIVAGAAVVAVAVSIAVALKSEPETGEVITADSLTDASPLLAPPEIPPGNTLAERWARTKANPKRLHEITGQPATKPVFSVPYDTDFGSGPTTLRFPRSKLQLMNDTERGGRK